MPFSRPFGRLVFRVFLVLGVVAAAAAGTAGDEFDPPSGYYAGATGTGATLKSQLRTAMTIGHIQRNYGQFRSSARIHDADPDNPGNILTVYDRVSVSGQWDSGVTWNREHVWPQSRQPGSASNSSTGNLGDPHALRPAIPSTNGSRSNKPFGLSTTTGTNRSLGTFYFTGDTDRGDTARILFYSDTRWSSLGLSLVNGVPSGNQMGDLASLVAWHYLDPPDTFERRRNHAIFSPVLNPVFFTNNRNAYIDLPGVVWSIYKDQQNDSRLRLGPDSDPDGASLVETTVNTIVGVIPDPIRVTLHKNGDDGTYYAVTASAALEPSVMGSHNAFAIGSAGEEIGIDVSISPDAVSAPGLSVESLVVDNLDVTTQGGAGRGANDADDVLAVELGVYAPSDASLDETGDLGTLGIDLGVERPGDASEGRLVEVFNIATDPLAAPFDVEVVSSSGDTDAFTLTPLIASMIEPGFPGAFEAVLSSGDEGSFSATYTIRTAPTTAIFGDLGAPSEDLVVTLTGVVDASACAADFAPPFGEITFPDVSAFLGAFAEGDLAADLDGDGVVSFPDITIFLGIFANGCP